jgi:hypothetical protein
MLVTGMALIIPTCIIYLNATDGSDLPVESEPLPALEARHAPSLVHTTQGAVSLRVPSVQIFETPVSEELRSLGVTENAEVNVALFGGTF